MHFAKTELDGVVLIKPDIFQDARGIFFESYHKSKFSSAGITDVFVQSNHSRSLLHSLRGLHAQVKHPQGKLVRVITGVVFDVAVDIRLNSPTYSQWVGYELSGENHNQLYISPGFAHGLCVLSDVAEIEYKCTDFYRPDDQLSIRWDDPTINIKWPIKNPILSDQDENASKLIDIEDILNNKVY